MNKKSRLKGILFGLVRGREFPKSTPKNIEIRFPGYEGITMKMEPSGYSEGRMDFETAGNEFCAAMEHLPTGVYRVIQRNIITEVLSKTYTLDELYKLREGIEQIGSEAVKDEKGFNSLFHGRDREILDMKRILDYTIASKQD